MDAGGRARARRVKWIAAFALLLLMASSGRVLADSGSKAEHAPIGPTSRDFSTDLSPGGPGSIEPMFTHPAAAEGVAHRDLGRDEALQLLKGVFDQELQAPAGVFDGLQVKKFLAPNVAVIPADKQPEATESDTSNGSAYHGPALLDSTVPLQVESASGARKAVDLSLERSGKGLQPVNPLVEVGAPGKLGEGIDLPEQGVAIELIGAPGERSPTTVDESIATYPNVAQDTDFAVAPAPTGVETFTQLRSAESPTSQTFRLGLPDGASLNATKDGGAIVTRGGETIIGIPPPSAIDAEGANIPVDLEVSDNRLTLRVSPSGSSHFPLLLDPLFQTYQWESSHSWEDGICNSSFEFQQVNNCGTHEEWSSEFSTQRLPPTIEPQGQFWGWSSLVGQGTPGLFISSSGTVNAGDRGAWNYTVPRYFKDWGQFGEPPTSFISHLTLTKLLWQANSEHYSPYLGLGIWDPIKGEAVSYYTHEGLVEHGLNDLGWQYEFANPGNDTNAKIGYVTVNASETQPNSYADVYVGAATVELADNQAPNQPTVTDQSGWVNQTAPPIAFTAADSGLGVRSMIASTEQRNQQGQPLHTWNASYGCIGVGDSACPRIWESGDPGHQALTYEPALLPQGINYLDVSAEDPVGNVSSPWSTRVKVDHTAPILGVSGTATEQGRLGPELASYSVRWGASDGSEASPQSGVAKTVVKVDGEVVSESAPGCPTRNCSISGEWLLQSGEYEPGGHVIEVSATDEVGLTTTRQTQIELAPPPPPTLTLSGSATEQATLGADRPWYALEVDASTGEEDLENELPLSLAPAFGSSGSGDGQLNHPADIAVDSEGHLWVADQNNGRIEEFNAQGDFLGEVGGGLVYHPVALAIDAEDDIWVVDSEMDNVSEFRPSGKLLNQFGGAGTSAGRFSQPEGIAVSPYGEIWVSDSGNGRLQVFNQAGQFLTVVGSHGSGYGEIGRPAGIDVSESYVWVADSEDNRIEQFGLWGGELNQIGTAGSGAGQFEHPSAVTVDDQGHVWVGDEENARVQEFDETGGYLGQFGSMGSEEFQFSLDGPMGIAADTGGRLWVTDSGNDRVQEWESPVYERAFGHVGSGNGQFDHPAGVAFDTVGNEWVADEQNDRIEEFDEKGTYLGQFGSSGSGDGQLDHPSALAVDSMGNVWVADTGNDRVEEFDETGEYLRQFGSFGSGEGQLSSPQGIALDPSGYVYVSDTGNDRILKFRTDGEYVRQIGSSGSEKGQLDEPAGLGVFVGPTFRLVYVADRGNDRVEAFVGGGKFIAAVGEAGSGPRQLDEPTGIAIAQPPGESATFFVTDRGNGRVQEWTSLGTAYLNQFVSPDSEWLEVEPEGIAVDHKGHIWVTDATGNRVQQWDQSAIPALSGLTAELRLDGKRVDSEATACRPHYCTLSKDWTLKANDYESGEHTITAKVTDSLGWETIKTEEIETQPDTTKPTIEAGGELIEAPEGWVEQESYALAAVAEDGGYGVTSLEFKIDGETVASETQSCVDGGCEASLSKSLDMAEYPGGAHQAELVATDGAGNTTTKKWTINVDPEGHISSAEAEDTLEALDATSESTIVAPNSEVSTEMEILEGYEPTLVEGTEAIETEGTPDKSIISTDPEGGFEIELPEEESITAEPLEVSQGAVSPEIAEEAAVVTGNTSESGDTVLRPIYDGLMTFGVLRDKSGPEQFSWKVNLSAEQAMRQVDPQHVEIFYEDDGHEVALISAELAHDAVGTIVPTALSLTEGDVLTLTVEHREASYVYPVVAGAGWEGGFQTEVVAGPKDEQEIREEEERLLHEEWEAMERAAIEDTDNRSDELYVSPPEHVSAAEAEVEDLAAWHNGIEHKSFRWIRCHHMDGFPDVPEQRENPGGVCGNPFKHEAGEEDVAFSYGIRGDYYIVPGQWVKHRGSSTEHIECAKMLNSENIENWGLIHWSYYIFPANECKWYGHTRDGGGSFAEYGQHITPYGEWIWGFTTGNEPQHVGLALYLWAAKDEHVGHHETTCIDCY